MLSLGKLTTFSCTVVTHIGDGAFIGSNSSLVAPVSIGAGSIITKDVDSEVLTLGHGKQTAINNW